MDRIRKPQQFLVARLLGFRRKLGRVLPVQVVECLYRVVPSPLAIGIERLEHAASDDFVCLVTGRWQPGRLHPPKYLFQPEQRLLATLVPHSLVIGSLPESMKNE